MSKTLAAEPENQLAEKPETELAEKKTALGTIIRKINKALNSSIADLMEAGTNFIAVEENKVYASDYDSFKEFVEAVFEKWTYPQIRRLMTEAVIYNAIKQAIPEGSAIPLPSSENQLRPFASFSSKPSVAGEKYVEFGAIAIKTGQPFTGANIQDFLKHGIIDSPSSAPKWVAKEAEITAVENLDDADIDFSTDTAPAKFRTVAATHTLDKIESLATQGVFPENVRQHIEDQTLLISDDDLERWGLYDEETFIKIGRLFFGTRTADFNFDSKGALSLNQITRILEKKLDENTSLLNTVHLTIAKGGKEESFVKFRGFVVEAKPIK